MAAYTVTKEITFGHLVDVRTLGAVINEQGASLSIELKIRDGVYAKLANWTFTSSVGPVSAHHGQEISTKGTTYNFVVVGSVDWWIDESRLT